MPLILPNDIEADTTADAVEVEQNYNFIEQYVNTNVITRDGAVAMTNPLLLPGDPSHPNQAANKGYVDGVDLLKVAKAGDTMTGPLILPATQSTDANSATNKGYVDGRDALFVPLAGATMSGWLQGPAMFLTEPQSAHAHGLTRRDYVDTGDAANAATTATKVAKTGDTMSGSLTVGGVSSTSYYAQVGGNPTADAPGSMLRGDGVIFSRLEDPSTISTHNLVLERAGTAAGPAGGTYVGFYRSAATAGAVAQVGSIKVNAGGSGVDYNTTSDYRLKDDLGPVEGAVERLLQLQPKRFRAKGNGVEEEGFMAHEVAEVIPNAVSGEKDGAELQQLAPMRLIPLLVAAVQQLTARVAELEAV